MKIIKNILIAIVGFIALVLIIALFVKKNYSVQREIVIDKPDTLVFNYIKHLKNQDNFSTWAKKDPEMKKEYKGTDGTVGFVSAWDGNKEVGTGEQEIKSIKEGERIDYELRFIKPFEGVSQAYLTTEPVSATQTKVKWGFDGKGKYPMNIIHLFMDMDKMVGGDLQTGLQNLKAILEKQ